MSWEPLGGPPSTRNQVSDASGSMKIEEAGVAPLRKDKLDGRASIVVSPFGGPRITDALGALLDEREEYLAQLQPLRDRLLEGARPADRVATMLKTWLVREGHWAHA